MLFDYHVHTRYSADSRAPVIEQLRAAKKAGVADQAAPTYTKEQLVKAKTLNLPRDAVAAVLEDGKVYTKDQAVSLVTDFLERKV